MKKISLAVLFAVLMGFFSLSVSFADDISPAMMSKLDAISAKQDQILSELASIRTELNIVKVRTTLNG